MNSIESKAWRCDLFDFDLLKVSDETDLSLSGTFNSWDQFNSLCVVPTMYQNQTEQPAEKEEGVLIGRKVSVSSEALC